MSQGEAVSLLVRIYKETKEEKYLFAAMKAIKFMLTDVRDGGVCKCDDLGLILLEYTHLPLVMNGWIFALFGLYDCFLLTGEYEEEFQKSVNSLEKILAHFDCGYWSMYDEGGKIASPFYHNLHIAQMKALYMVTKKKIFNEYAEKFERYQKKFLNKSRAFIRKSMQKLRD